MNRVVVKFCDVECVWVAYALHPSGGTWPLSVHATLQDAVNAYKGCVNIL